VRLPELKGERGGRENARENEVPRRRLAPKETPEAERLKKGIKSRGGDAAGALIPGRAKTS